MTYGIEIAEMVDVDRVFLDNDNPRHEPYDTQDEVIDYLCKDEYVFQLAKDISKHGLSPLELFALVHEKPTGVEKGDRYIVSEGNRRLCALKLLNDPDLAPAKKRKDFEALSKSWTPIPKIFAVIFNDKKDVRLWVDRIHGGLQGGIGRKTWNAEQKTRHSGNTKNTLAQSLLDYAEKEKFISAEERKGKITTVQRYLGNQLMREALGIDNSNPEDFSRDRVKSDFDILTKQFITDLLSGVVNSRSMAKDIKDYSREMGGLEGLSGKRVEPESLNPDSTGKAGTKPAKPKKPKVRQKLPYDEEIYDSLKAIPSYKLSHLYYSVCDINLPKHTPMLSIGVWAFLETLTACHGRNDGTSFVSYLSVSRLASLGLGLKNKTKSLRQAINRIAEYGNSTKHHKDSASFNGEQLANDVETMGPMMLALAKEAKV